MNECKITKLEKKNESKTTVALQRRSEHASGILFSFLFLFGDEEIPTEQPPHAGGGKFGTPNCKTHSI
jgi:hypothetical protein